MRKIATIESIGSSTRIEGETLTDQEVKELLKDIKITKLKTRDEQEVIGYYEVLELIYDNYADIRLSENYIKQLHQMLLKYSIKDERYRGTYKFLTNKVVATHPTGEQRTIFATTEPAWVATEMQELTEWTNEQLEYKSIHPLIIIASFIYDFLSIHPFQDGNGRLSRLLTTLCLLQNNYSFIQYISLENHIEQNKKAYYEALNDQFKQYDALLYELVAPEGTRVPRGGRQQTGADPLSGLQTGMKDVLGLEFQLDHIDYHQDNFIHADMSPEEFMESMSKNDESFAKMFFKMLGSSMAIQGSQSSMDESDLVLAMFSRDREMKMRRAMAKQLSGADLAMVAFEGKDGSTIIEHRNGKCFEILEREIKAGKQKVGVFYGAGHLPDMEKRLLEMGFSKTGQPLWYVAWPLRREAMPTVVPESVKSYPAQPQNAADPVEGSPSDARPAPAEETKTEEQDTEIDSSVPCKDCPPSRGRLFRRKSQR